MINPLKALMRKGSYEVEELEDLMVTCEQAKNIGTGYTDNEVHASWHKMHIKEEAIPNDRLMDASAGHS